jgi:hypothetical protein
MVPVDEQVHPGMFAQFKSRKARRARAVAVHVPGALEKKAKKRVPPEPGGKYAALSGRERASIMRKIMRGT